MNEQLSMNLTAESQKEKDFWKFHEANPRVYKLLVDYARRWRRANPSVPVGIDLLYARIRWDFAVNTETVEARRRMASSEGTVNNFKLSNNHKPYYARLIMEKNPDLKGVFVTKKQKHQSTIDGWDNLTDKFNKGVIDGSA